MDKIFRNAAGKAGASGSSSTPLSSGKAWRQALPVLVGGRSSLREPVAADARALLTAIDGRDLIHVLPLDAQPNLQSLEELAVDCQSQRAAGTSVSWVVVPADGQSAVGIISVRGLDHGFTMVEVTAAIADEFRGTGLFQDAVRQVLDCLFGVFGVHRIEARVDIRNARANGALRKLGATQEGVLRHAHYRDGQYHDHVMWAIVVEDWTAQRSPAHVSVH